MAKSTVVKWKLGKAIERVVNERLGDGHQTALAKILKVSPAAVNQYFNGLHPMSEETIFKIAGALGITWLALIEEVIEQAKEEGSEDVAGAAPQHGIAPAPLAAEPTKIGREPLPKRHE